MDSLEDAEHKELLARAFENEIKRENGELPRDLDLVLIDGRWAQTIWGGNMVCYLDDNTQVPIDWSEYRLERKIDTGLINLDLAAKDIQFPAELIDRIHWEQKIEGEAPEITRKKKINIHVFGIFVKKELHN